MLKYLNISDLIIVTLLPVFASIISVVFKLNYIYTILIFCLPLGIWLSYKSKLIAKKAAVFSTLVSIPVITIIDYIAVLNDAWFVPNSIITIKLFNIVAVENVLGGLLHVFCVVAFYEYFFNRVKVVKTNLKKMKLLMLPLSIIFFIFILTALNKGSVLNLPYAYFWLGLGILTLPVILFIINFPRLFWRFTLVAFYFFIFLGIFEFTGLRLNHWLFPGSEFLAWVQFFEFKMPIEEFVFFLIVSTYTVLCFYEFFDDDSK